MANTKRVPAGVPTGGEFATGERAENPDLDAINAKYNAHVFGRWTPETHEEKVDRHAAIWKVINDRYLIELEEERATTYTTGMMALGERADGDRVDARLNLVLDMTEDTDMGDWIAYIDARIIPAQRRRDPLGISAINASALDREEGDFGELAEFAKVFSPYSESNRKLDPNALEQALTLMDRMRDEAQR